MSIQGTVGRARRNERRGDTVSGEKITPVKIGILQVWVKQDGAWKLLAR
jgi:hypothetical protein